VSRTQPPAAGGTATAHSPEPDSAAPGGASGAGRDRRRRDIAVIGGPAVLAFVLGLIEITGRSLGFDEGATVTIAAQHGGALGSGIAHDGGNMSGYYLALHVLTSVFGTSELAIRLPSAIATAATSGLVVILAVRLFDRRVALISGLLTAVSLPLVYWGQNARGYAPMVAFTVAAFLSLVVLVDAEATRGARRLAWIGYVVFTVLAIYSSFVAVLVVPAQLVTVLWYRRAARPLAAALVAIAACCVPLVALAFRRGSGQLFWLPRPTLTGEKEVFQALTGAGLQPNFHPTITTTVFLVATLVLLLGIAAMIIGRVLRGPREKASWAQALVLTWLVFPVAFAWIESYFGQPILLPRNLLACAPAVAILLALGLTHARVPRPLALAVLMAILALRVLQLAPSYGVSPEGWQAAGAHVLAGARPADCVAFYPTDGRMAFQYYLGTGRAVATAPRPVLPTAPWGTVRTYVEDYATLTRSQLAGIASRCPRLWLVASHVGERDGPAGALAHRARYLRLRAAVARAYSHRRTIKFGYASAVQVELATR
jgi:mannosyltransferase